MITATQVEKLADSAVKLTITVPQSDVAASYETIVAKYEKSAQIKGFRKGKAPRNVLERKFGESFKIEALQEILDAGLKESFEKVAEKPLPYSQPELTDEVDLDVSSDLTFSVRYDIYPEITLGEYRGLDVEEAVYSITKADETREIENLREQNALVIEKEDGIVADGNIVSVDISEVDASGETVAGTEEKNVTITVGPDSDRYHLGSDIIGMKTAETRIIEKTYPDDFSDADLSGKSKRLHVEIKSVKARDIPELDDDFAQDVSDSFETLDDLKKDIRKRLDTNATARVRSLKSNQIMDQLVASSTFELPESMIRAELESSWRSMVSQYRTTEEQMEKILSLQGKSKEDIFVDWKSDAEQRLRRTLIIQKILEVEKIEITDEEAEAHLREEAAANNSDVEQVVEYYKNNGMLSYVQQELAEKRLFDSLIESAKVKKGKKQSYLDLMSDNQ